MPINTFCSTVRDTLLNVIDDHVLRKNEFVKNPHSDFTRNRKLSLESIIKTTLFFSSSSLDKELLEYFDYDENVATSSAFVQQRDKISSSLFNSIFKNFTSSFSNHKTFKGYRVLAVDGSKIRIPHDPNDFDSYCLSNEGSKGYNFLCASFLYDLVNKTFLDVDVRPQRLNNEPAAFIDMLKPSSISGKVLVVADRGYEGYNLFANVIEKNWKFLIRLKEKGILSRLVLPDKDEFDMDVSFSVTKSKSKYIRDNYSLFRSMDKSSRFDFLDDDNLFYPLAFRVVKVKLDNGKFQFFATNLDRPCFDLKSIKILYKMRWNIETSFRDLKHPFSLYSFHSKKRESIIQEIFSKMIMYNFCSFISSQITIKNKDRKFDYQINFSKAITICREFFRLNNTSLDIEKLISRYILPVKPNRNFPRMVRKQPNISFNYRVS